MISKARSGFSTTDLAAGLLLCLAGVAGGREMDLAELSIEELMNIEVTSPSRKEQAMFAAPAAISVLTGEDLRRAGVTTIPAALRLVPGVQVGRADANKWAVSARGFNDFFANKLLVLIDGRSVYSPMFSGVFWESQDVVMGDVERIEVIRGPGGTLWGANAVNGVINIITRDARDTQGGLVRAGSGSAEEAFGTARFGGQLDETAYYRVYAKYFRRSGSEDIEGRELADDWHVARAGTRLDWELSDRDALTLQGEIYDGEAGQTYRLATSLLPPYVETFANKAGISGGHLLGRWEHALGGARSWSCRSTTTWPGAWGTR